ncbi:MAG: hemolysin activation/secretion protein [Pseudanabaena sp.]|nr:MAG: hemolysin activation/secretion protein [Pseudanabaena sp.]
MSNFYVLNLLGIVWIGLIPSQVFAQTTNLPATAPVLTPRIIAPTTPPPLPQGIPAPLPSPDELLKSPSQIAPPVDTKPPQTGAIAVKQFQVLGSTVFSTAELNEVLDKFTKRSLTFNELLQARSAITDLYISKGYITSGAFIPPQNLQSGIVKIQVIEGGLEEIIVTGTNRLSPDYIRSRINIATGAPLNRDRLIEALQVLQINPLIASLSAELSAGDRPGKNILELKVSETQTFNLQLSLDNNTVPSIGSFSRGLQISEANLTGLGDSLTVAYSNTDGSNVYNLNYSIPINPYNGTLAFAFSNTNSNVIEAPFNVLDIYANSTTYSLTFRQPVLQTPNQELAFGAIGSYSDSLTSLLGIPFPLSAGANDNGVTKVSVLSFFQDYVQRSSQSVLAFRNQINIGLDGIGSTVNARFPDSRFVSFRGQAQYVNLLAPETLLLFRSDIQLSDRPLVPIQQISFGGQDTLRGYRQDLLLGDNGASLSAELRVPVLRVPEIEGILQIAPFIDSGMVWTSSGEANPPQNLLVGTGMGLRWQMGTRMTAVLNYGIPLMNVPNRRINWQENGIYFSVIYNLF